MRLIIYKTLNLINSKIYIGQHKQTESEHFDTYLGSGTIISNAIKKYGKQNFKKEILEICDTEDVLNEREIYWIKFYNSTNRDIGYNILEGGEGSNKKFRHHGKTLKEAYGVERSNHIKEQIRKGNRPSKGKTLEEAYGIQKATEMKRKMKVPKTESHIKKLKDSAKKRGEKTKNDNMKSTLEFLDNLSIDEVLLDNDLHKSLKSILRYKKVDLQKEYPHLYDKLKELEFIKRSNAHTGILHTDESKDKISKAKKGKSGNPNKSKGLTLEEYYGEEKAKALKEKLRIASTGKAHREDVKKQIGITRIRNGNHIQSEETKKKISNTLICTIIIIDGIEFKGYKAAEEYAKVSRATIRTRCKSDKYPNYEIYKT